MTIKSQVLEYVATKRGATYTEIITFVCKLNGITYDYRKNRGYYSSAFSSTANPYFLTGKDRLSKFWDGKYYAVFGKTTA